MKTKSHLSATCLSITFLIQVATSAISCGQVGNCGNRFSVGGCPSSGGSPGGGGGSGAFVPSSISGLQLWLAADKISGLGDGASVSAWSDASGNSNDAAQSTASYQPTYSASLLNGKPAVRFNGTTQYIGCTSGSFSLNGTEAFVVARVNNNGANKGVLNFSNATTIDYVTGNTMQVWSTGYNGSTATGADSRWDGDNIGISNLTAALNQWWLYDFSASGPSNSVSTTVWANGSQIGTGTQTEPTPISPTRYLIGARYQTPGSPNTVDSWANVDVAEILVYGTALSSSQRQQVTQYLDAKYQIY